MLGGAMAIDYGAGFVYSWQRTVDPKTKATDAFYFAPG